MRPMRWLPLVLAVALVAGGCGGGDDDDDTSTDDTSTDGTAASGDDDAAEVDPSLCPVDALTDADKPVEIEYWHAMTRANEEELIRLTDEFNASQSDVRVTLSASPSYPENLTRYTAGLSTDELPDLYQGEETNLQLLIDSQSIVPAAACIAAADYDTSGIIERVLTRYTVEGIQYAMPFNVSNPILYYNKTAFTAAGLDPEAPPTTLEEVRETSQAIVDSGVATHGISFKTDAWFTEQWMAKAGEEYVNNGNGRDARATAVAFDNETGLALYTWLSDMEKDGLLVSTGTGDLEHYVAIPNNESAMTIDSSAALGTIFQLFDQGQYANVDLGAAPMPGPASADGGVLVGGASNYVVNRSSDAEQAAAWKFAEFLADEQTQSEWAAATGYIPIREASTTISPLVERWVEQPELKVAYDQLLAGADNLATAGPVLGPAGARGEGMRGAVIDAIAAMFAEGLPPEDALAQATEGSNEAIEDYNDRVG